MRATIHATFITVLETLKAHDCIAGYTIIGEDVNPKWKEAGVDKALRELIGTARPFGLRKKAEIAVLLLVLPQKEKDQFDTLLFAGVQKQYGLPLGAQADNLTA